jgi:hypothetical protein
MTYVSDSGMPDTGTAPCEEKTSKTSKIADSGDTEAKDSTLLPTTHVAAASTGKLKHSRKTNAQRYLLQAWVEGYYARACDPARKEHGYRRGTGLARAWAAGWLCHEQSFPSRRNQEPQN